MTANRWKINFTKRAQKSFLKLDRDIQFRIRKFLVSKILKGSSALDFGKPLHGPRNGLGKGLWSYRVGDYRIICRVQKNKLVVLIVEIGHRSSVYEDMD